MEILFYLQINRDISESDFLRETQAVLDYLKSQVKEQSEKLDKLVISETYEKLKLEPFIFSRGEQMKLEDGVLMYKDSCGQRSIDDSWILNVYAVNPIFREWLTK